MSFSEEPFGDTLLFVFPKENEKEVWLFEFPFCGPQHFLLPVKTTLASTLASLVLLLFSPTLLTLSKQAPIHGESDALRLMGLLLPACTPGIWAMFTW